MLRYLVRETACTLSAVDKEGYTPLHIAAEKGNVECVRVLVEGPRPAGGPPCDLGRCLEDGYTALRLADARAQRGSQRHAFIASILR